MGDRSDSTYVIRTGLGALDRLELLAQLFWPTTEAFLARTGAFGAGRFLDVGCGIGDVACRVAHGGSGPATGVDLNSAAIGVANERVRRLGLAAEFRVLGLGDLGSAPGLSGFDVAYARCVISHLRDPADGLASMCSAVRGGGLVLIEDVDVTAVWSSPRSAALDRYVELYMTAARGLGASPDVARDLPALLRRVGATDVDVDVAQPLLKEPAELHIHARTMEAIAEPVIAQGLASRDEVADLVAALDELATTPGFVATLPRIVQVHGYVPLGS